MWAQAINVALGIWIMAAPAALGYEQTAASNNDHIVGPLIASFAFVALAECTRNVRGVNVPLGLWMVVAALLLNYPTAGAVNAILTGLAVILLSLVRGKYDAAQYGGGWIVLFRGPLDSRSKQPGA